MRLHITASLIAGFILVLACPNLSSARACIATPPAQPDVMIPFPRDLPQRLSVVAGTRITFALPHVDGIKVETTRGLAVRSKPGNGQLIIETDPYGGGREATLVVEYRREKRVTIVELLRWVPPQTPPVMIDLTDRLEDPSETIRLSARTELEIRVASEDGQVDVRIADTPWTPERYVFDAARGIFSGLYTLSSIERGRGSRIEGAGEVEVTIRATAGQDRLKRLRIRPIPTPVC